MRNGQGATAEMIMPPPRTTQVTLEHQRHGYLLFDRSRRIIHTSSGLRALLRIEGLGAAHNTEDLRRLVDLTCGSDPETQWWDRLSEELTNECLMLRTAKEFRTIHVDVNPLGDQYWIARFDDVTVKADDEEVGVAIAYQDRLTGIGNRLLFERSLDRMLDQIVAREIKSATVLFLDLDRFKTVNDTLGHAVGDALLRIVGERLQRTLHHGDTLARLGGDEFAVLLHPGSAKETAASLAAQIIELIQRPYLIEGQVINVGSSIGIASAPEDGSSRDHLLKSADLALYHSKASGRGVFHYFHRTMEERAQQRRSLELDLRKALALRQFELHYQPQIDVETKKITGLEGLLRWRHPERGLLIPGVFISLAEEIGMAVPIGNWVLRTACKEALRWPDSVTVAVNISPLQFETVEFEQFVGQTLKATGLPGKRLEIEVTEDILLRNGHTVLETLEALRLLGVKVAMDNFGTGLASLSQLVNFPFDKIKIDGSLVGLQQPDAKNRAIVRAISALGQSLGICTLAEGVETSEHLAQVRSEGCQSVQGFYYSAAVPSSELAELFSNYSTRSISSRLINNRGE